MLTHSPEKAIRSLNCELELLLCYDIRSFINVSAYRVEELCLFLLRLFVLNEYQVELYSTDALLSF